MMRTKQEIIDDIIRVEGGYVNDPADSGGETNFGITEEVGRVFGYTGGTVSNVQKNGVRISTDTNINFTLKPDETFTLTYSAVPVVTETTVN